MTARRLTDEFLKGIASQYNEHVKAERMPAPAIAKTEGINVRTVHRWVHQARKMGFLPPGTPPGLCGGKVAPKPLGATGNAVRRNIRLLRDARRLSTVKLAVALRDIGRPIPATGITRIEKGERRVDVDDLAALGAVFGVEPATLLIPPPECETCHGAPPPGFICAACGTIPPRPASSEETTA